MDRPIGNLIRGYHGRSTPNFSLFKHHHAPEVRLTDSTDSTAPSLGFLWKPEKTTALPPQSNVVGSELLQQPMTTHTASLVVCQKDPLVDATSKFFIVLFI